MDASAKTTSSPLPPANIAEAVVIPVLPADARRSSRQNGLDSLAGAISQQIKRPSNDVRTSSPYNSRRNVLNTNRLEDESPNSLTTKLVNAKPNDDLAAKLVDADNASAVAASNLRTRVFVPASILMRNAISFPPPAYPALARSQRIEGDVLLQASVDEVGRVETVVVVNGPEALRSAAMDALSNWRFSPYVVDGHPVPIRTLVDFHFKMDQ
jgi:TonB family protein